MELTGFEVRYEKPVCTHDICMGCRQIDDCADAIRYLRNTLRKRTAGLLTHQQLLEENSRRFGTADHSRIVHWKDLIGDQLEIFKALAEAAPESRANTINKMSDNAKEVYNERLKTLNYYGWFAPYIENGQLKFMTTHNENEEPEILPDVSEGGWLK